LGILIWDCRVCVDADTANSDISLLLPSLGTHDMLKQIYGVYRQVINNLPLNKRNRTLLNGPQINATVSPLNGKQVQATPRSAQIITRAKLSPATLKSLFD
jgi:hypothetical protein